MEALRKPLKQQNRAQQVKNNRITENERTETVIAGSNGAAADEFVVYSLGTLYGEWPDGTPFEGNRYVDRYVVKSGLITHMDVWNDSAEWLMVRAGLAVL